MSFQKRTIGTIHHKNGTSDGYSFSEANYNAGKCGSGHTLTSDIPQGNVTYDAATANMEYPWKMPTKDQLQELIDNTTSAWTSMNGVKGTLFISKSDLTKYIFLPAAGRFESTSHYYIGQYGIYWSTGLTSYSHNAWYINLGSNGASLGDNWRSFGPSIRPIRPLKF